MFLFSLLAFATLHINCHALCVYCVSYSILCGDSYFGCALIPHHTQVRAVVTVVVLKCISMFC